MKSVGSTPSSARKAKRNYLEEYIPLYKKFGVSNPELELRPKTYEKHDASNKKISPESPKHQITSSKFREKQAVDISQIIIDGSNLNSSAGGSTPHNESKVTSTPIESTKKSAKFDKNLKKNASTVDHTDDASESLSTSKSQKRSKSVSFLLEEKDQAVVKKLKSNDSLEGATADLPQKVKKHKKNKKSEKENKASEDQLHLDEPVTKKKDRFKNKYKSKTEETPIQLEVDNETDQGDSAVIDKNFKKHSEKKNKEKSETETIQSEKTKKSKKQKYHDKNDEEPASKSPRTERELIADNLKSLNLGDNTYSLTNLIDEMVVVDKAKQNKKLRKTANRETKQHQIIKQDVTEKKQIQNETQKQQQKENKPGDSKDEVQGEKKKWVAKRWNKCQIADRDQKTTINVDNLPVSMLKGNFKKVLIDHFSKYGISRSIGEPFTQNEGDTDSVFTTKVYFVTAEAATEALEMDGSIIAGNEIRVSPMRPMTETVLVIRIYGHPNKLNAKDVSAAFHEVGHIRSIRPMLRKKKTMATAFVEFEGPDAVERAIQKCAGLSINGKQVLASPFIVRTSGKKRKRGSKRKGAKNPNESGKDKSPEDSGSDDSDD